MKNFLAKCLDVFSVYPMESRLELLRSLAHMIEDYRNALLLGKEKRQMLFMVI